MPNPSLSLELIALGLLALLCVAIVRLWSGSWRHTYTIVPTWLFVFWLLYGLIAVGVGGSDLVRLVALGKQGLIGPAMHSILSGASSFSAKGGLFQFPVFTIAVIVLAVLAIPIWLLVMVSQDSDSRWPLVVFGVYLILSFGLIVGANLVYAVVQASIPGIIMFVRGEPRGLLVALGPIIVVLAGIMKVFNSERLQHG